VASASILPTLTVDNIPTQATTVQSRRNRKLRPQRPTVDSAVLNAEEIVLQDDLYFVNRKNESLKLAQELLKNHKIQSMSNRRLPLLPQPFGTGKTSFAMQFRNVLENKWDDLIQTHTDAYSLRDAHMLYLDFRNFVSIPGASLYDLIICFIAQAMVIDPYYQIAIPQGTFLTVGKLIHEIEKHDKYTIICFDETDQIHAEKHISNYFNIQQRGEGIQQDVERMFVLWDILSQFLAAQRIYLICISRSPTIFYIHKGLNRPTNFRNSPSEILDIALPPLYDEYYNILFEKTQVSVRKQSTMSTVSLMKVLQVRGVTGDLLNTFNEKLFQYTGGVARSIRNVILSLLETTRTFRTETEIEAFLIGSAQARQKTIDVTPQRFEHDWSRLFHGLMVAAAMKIPLNQNMEMKISGAQRQTFLLDMLCHLNFHYTPAEDDSEKVIITVSKYAMESFERTSAMEDIVSHYSFVMCKQWVSSKVVNSGAILEEVTTLAILNHIMSQQSLSSRPLLWRDIANGIFADCFFAEIPVKCNITNGVIMCCAMGAEDIRIPVLTADLQKYPWGYKVPCSPSGFKFLCKNEFIKEGYISHPAPQSKGTDIIVAVEEAAERGCYNCLKLQMKNVSTFTWSDAEREINKVAKATKDLNVTTTLVFVVVKYGPEMQHIIATSSSTYGGMLLKSGYYYLDSSPKRISHTAKRRKKTTNEKFYIPSNMEVLFLSEKGLSKLLGDTTVGILKEAQTVDKKIDVFARHSKSMLERKSKN
jgi:hypothetical protein